MNKYIIKMLCFVAFLGLLVGACKEKSDKLLVGTWQGSDFISNVTDLPPDIMESAKEAVRKMSYTFNADSTFTKIIMGEKVTGTWMYDAKTKKLSFNYGEFSCIDPQFYELASVTGNELKLKNSFDNETYEYLIFEKK